MKKFEAGKWYKINFWLQVDKNYNPDDFWEQLIKALREVNMIAELDGPSAHEQWFGKRKK